MMEKESISDKPDPEIIRRIIALGLMVYISFYAFESPIRYALYLVGLDPLIFLRDVVIVSIIGVVFIFQLFEKKIKPYFFLYFFVVFFHGLVMIINTGSVIAVVYSAKVLVTMLFGAIAASFIFNPNKKILLFYFFVWIISVLFIFLHKYYLEFPWRDMTTTLFGLDVEVSRDWTLEGLAKRASGFYRASINAGMLVPLIALILVFSSKNIILRIIIIIITLFILYLTTMKGSLLSFFIVSSLVLGAVVIKFLYTARVWSFVALVLMITFPLFLPGYRMPEARGQFTIESFNLRVHEMWPEAWLWINSAGTFPFGVGLGGISGAQRFYSIEHMNAADNMFVFLYAYFGILSFLYLGWAYSLLLRVRCVDDIPIQRSVAILTFLIGYGIVLSMIEDQMCSLFIGAALAYLSEQAKQQKIE